MKAICDYFDVKDTTELTWAHRVNGQDYLAECCADPSLMMLEGDVQFEASSADFDTEEAVPFMAADEQDIANLTLEGWLMSAEEFKKGVKIDIRSPQAVEPTLAAVHDLELSIPVIIHGEIFNLLNAETPSAQFDPARFIRRCQQVAPTATISLGWSLKRSADEDGRMEDILIEQMTDLMFSGLGGHSYNVEIRGGYTPNWERGAALIFEPIPRVENDDTNEPSKVYSGNVVDGTSLFKKTEFKAASSNDF